jgi:hypothetical protein
VSGKDVPKSWTNAVVLGISVLWGVFVGFLVPVGISWFEREVKALDVTVLGVAPLVTARESVAEDIEILFRGQSVEALSLVQIRVENVTVQVVVQP